MHLPFKYCEPAFFSGLCDDPVLQVRVRPLGRSLLFDCGQIHHLAKRVLRSIDAVFISHAHMDHFMGMDTLIRHVLVAPRTIEIYGPPGIAARLEHKLRSYDWNLAEDFWCSFRVTEVHAERLHSFILAGPEGFACRPEEVTASAGRVVYANRFVRVEARSADHKIPVLIYRISEIPGFSVDEERLAALGLVPGPWLGELKSRYFSGNLSGTPLRVRRSSGAEPQEEWVGDAAVLYENVRVQNPPAAIGYFSDIGWTPDNRRKLKGLFSDLTLLIGECTFLAQDVARARASSHLCTTDLNALLLDLRPAYFLPMHLSKNYLGQSEKLFEELKPPPGTTILELPERLTPRPLLSADLPPVARGRW